MDAPSGAMDAGFRERMAEVARAPHDRMGGAAVHVPRGRREAMQTVRAARGDDDGPAFALPAPSDAEEPRKPPISTASRGRTDACGPEGARALRPGEIR